MITTFADQHTGSQRPQPGFISYVLSKWQDYKLMRNIESVPYDVMKDVGFPAAERTNEK